MNPFSLLVSPIPESNTINVDVTVYPIDGPSASLSFTDKFSVRRGAAETLILRNGQHLVYNPENESFRLVGTVEPQEPKMPPMGNGVIRNIEMTHRSAMSMDMVLTYGDRSTEKLVISTFPGATQFRSVMTQRGHILTINLTTGKVLVVRGSAALPSDQKATPT